MLRVSLVDRTRVLNLNQLRVFRAVFEEQNITGAARKLRISQPAVSKQLAELEAALGTPLVDRLPRGVRLTAAGELLRSHTQRLFQAEADAEAALAGFLGLAQGRLAVGASTTVGSYLVPVVFGDFHKQHPEVQLELEIANTASIQQALREGQIDVGLTEGLVAGEELDVEVFAHDEIVMIAPPDHPLCQAKTISSHDLAQLPLILRERGSGTRDVVESALGERGVTPSAVMTLGASEAVKNAVSQGLGLAMLSRLTVELELSVGRFKELKLSDLQLRRALHRLTLKSKQPSPATEEFLRLLRKRYGG